MRRNHRPNQPPSRPPAPHPPAPHPPVSQPPAPRPPAPRPPASRQPMNVEMGTGGPLLPPYNLPLMALLAPPPPPPPLPSTSSQIRSNTPRNIAPSSYTAPPPAYRPPVYSTQPVSALPEMFDASRPPPPIVAHAQSGRKRRGEPHAAACIHARCKLRKPEPAEAHCKACLTTEIRVSPMQNELQKVRSENEKKAAFLKSKTEVYDTAMLILKSALDPLTYQLIHQHVESKPGESVLSQLRKILRRRQAPQEPQLLQTISSLVRSTNLVHDVSYEYLKNVLDINCNSTPTINGVNLGASTSRGVTHNSPKPSAVRSNDGAAMRQMGAMGSTFSMPPPPAVAPPPTAVMPPPVAAIPPVFTTPPPPIVVAAPAYTSSATNAGANPYIAPAPYGPAVPMSAYYQPGPTNQFQPEPSNQFQPGLSNQFQPGPSNQFQPGPSNQFQPGPSNQFQPGPSNQFQPVPSNQFQPVPSNQFQPGPSNQYQPVPSNQFQPGPSNQFQPGPSNQFQPGPSNQFQPGPSHEFQPPYTYGHRFQHPHFPPRQ